MFKDGLIILCSVLILLIIQHCSIMEKKKRKIYERQQKKSMYFYRFFRNNVFNPFKVCVTHNWIESGECLIKSSTEATVYSTSSELDNVT